MYAISTLLHWPESRLLKLRSHLTNLALPAKFQLNLKFTLRKSNTNAGWPPQKMLMLQSEFAKKKKEGNAKKQKSLRVKTSKGTNGGSSNDARKFRKDYNAASKTNNNNAI